MAGPLIRRNGADIYERDRSYYWYIWVWEIILTLLVLLIIILPVTNLSIVYNEVNAPGAIPFSARGRVAVTMTRLALVGAIFMIFFTLALITFRVDFGCNVVCIVFWCIGLLFLVLGMAFLTVDLTLRNKPDQYGNLFNDRQYCCAFPMATGCPNAAVCPGVTPDTLGTNPWALTLYILLVITLGFQLIFGAVVVGKWGAPLPKEKQEGEEEEEEQTKLVPAASRVHDLHKATLRAAAAARKEHRNE